MSSFFFLLLLIPWLFPHESANNFWTIACSPGLNCHLQNWGKNNFGAFLQRTNNNRIVLDPKIAFPLQSPLCLKYEIRLRHSKYPLKLMRQWVTKLTHVWTLGLGPPSEWTKTSFGPSKVFLLPLALQAEYSGHFYYHYFSFSLSSHLPTFFLQEWVVLLFCNFACSPNSQIN